MGYPSNFRYTKEHEWVKVDGGTATIGITDYAQSELGDVVFVELPKIGAKLETGKSFGNVESVKAVSEIYAPAAGEVTEANAELAKATLKRYNDSGPGTGVTLLQIDQQRATVKTTAAQVEVTRASLLVHLGEACLIAGDIEEALACAERSLAHARGRGERGTEAHGLRLLAEVASQRHPRDIGPAEVHYRDAMTRAGTLGMRPLLAHCHRGLGTLYDRADKTHAAREHHAAAAAMFDQMGMRRAPTAVVAP